MTTQPTTRGDAGGAAGPSNSTAMIVDRCICIGISFSKLREYVTLQGPQCGIDELKTRFGCGAACGLCVPYLRLMLATGRTQFPLIVPSTGATPVS